MQRWNIKLPAELDLWVDGPEFENQVVALGGVLVKIMTGMPWITIDLPDHIDPSQLPGVLFFEPDHTAYITSYIHPQFDADFSWATFRVHADQVFPHTKGDGVHIAVLDTGIIGHQAYVRADILSSESVLSGNNEDQSGHGSMVFSTIASDGLGLVIGTAPDAQYHIIQILAANVSGNTIEGGAADMAEGINLARQRGADLITMSINLVSIDNNGVFHSVFSQLVEDALEAFANGGGVAVVAAGNFNGQSPDGVFYPASSRFAIAVGATDFLDNIASFSSFGPWPDSPECVAPGVGVGVVNPFSGNEYQTSSGTSFSTPITTGSLALSMARSPQVWNVAGNLLDPKYNIMLPARVVRARELLRDTSAPVSGGRDKVGYGMVQADALADQPLAQGSGARLVLLLAAIGVGVGLVAYTNNQRR